MTLRVDMPVGARVRIMCEDCDPLHDPSEVGEVVKQPNTPGGLYLVQFADGRKEQRAYDELERVDMW